MIREPGDGYVPKFYIPTPSLLLNEELVGGGVPSGSIFQFQSEGEGSFKSSMALQMAGYAQKQGLRVAYVDAEGNLVNFENEDGTLFNPWLENLGVDVNKLYFVEPGPGEEIWEAVGTLITQHEVQFIIMDSIHGVRPSTAYNNEVGDNAIGQHAKLHQQGILKVLPLLRKHHAVLCGINQRRDNLTPQGKMGTNPSGGKSWGFYSRFNFVIKRETGRAKLESKEYIPLNIWIDKSRGGTAFKTISTFARQGYGVDQRSELAVLAENKGLIKKSGAWWKTAAGETIGQGEEARFAWAENNKQSILSNESDS
jgi:recombination protein RecA